MTINRKFFFGHVRQVLFAGRLNQRQVNGMTAILNYWEDKHSARDDRWLAYALGTTYHETDKTMQPIKEYGGKAYFTRRYDPPPTGKNPRVARQLGNIHAGDGALFCGRGFVQLTGRRNYTDWKNRLDIDLVGDPALALNDSVATQILIEGCILGTFTGKKLADYFNATKEDWVNARRIVNGRDKANLIAGQARLFYSAISYTV